MNVLTYESYAFDSMRSQEGLEDLLKHHFPGFKDRGIHRRTELINSFEEIELEDNTLIEEEDKIPTNIYFLLRG